MIMNRASEAPDTLVTHEISTESAPSPVVRHSDARARLMRAVCAVATTLAFVCSPLAAIAQQAAPPAGESAGEEAPSEPPAPAAAKPAGPTPPLFLLPTQGVNDELSQIIPERIGEMLRAQLKDKRSAVLLPTYDALMQQGGGNPNAALADAERMYTSGIGLLTAGQNDRAATSFQKSVDALEKNLGDLDNFNILVDAYRNMALAYFLAGFDFDARNKMKLYANLRPDATLEAEKFPAELREVYQAEADKVKKAGPGKLSISADADNARVFVDGVDKGQAPVELTDIGYGYHYLVVRAPGGAVWSEKIQVRGRGKAQSFAAKLGASNVDPNAPASNQPAFYTGLVSAIGAGKFSDAQLRPYLDELHSRTGAKYVAWVVMVKKRSSYAAVPFIYHVESGQLVREAEVSFTLALSNLRVGVNSLANAISGSVGTEPGEKAVASVDLTTPPPAAVATAPAPAEPVRAPSEPAAKTSVEPAPAEHARSVTPPPPVEPAHTDEDDSNMWMWVGIGGAAVLVAGAVVGGVMLMSDDAPSSAGKFDAALSW